MYETPEDLNHLQELLDRSIKQAGSFLRSSFQMPEHSLSASQLVQHLQGLQNVALATVSAKGEPRVAPIGSIFYRGSFCIPTVMTAARSRHIRKRPAVSLTHFEENRSAIIVHGQASIISSDAEGFEKLDEMYQGISGTSVRNWGEGIYIQVRADVIYTYTSTRQANENKDQRRDIPIQPIAAEDREWVRQFMIEHWGGATVASRGKLYRADELEGFIAMYDSKRAGLITYNIGDESCEIVTLNSIKHDLGIGTALIEAVKDAAQQLNCKRLWLITTNDNLHALGFYQNRGFALVAIHRNAVEAARSVKPQIPLTGHEGIPIRDEIELEMMLESDIHVEPDTHWPDTHRPDTHKGYHYM
jgi:GNAT superfamily N-acetyltransferase/uncharacterized pyridoxamine 5'-phosphate oxidase family protein